MSICRALVPVVDSCTETAPVHKFLVSECKFNNERANKVIDRALLLKEHENQGSIDAEESQVSSSHPTDFKAYTEQIQNKYAWGRLKTEVISSVYYHFHELT